MKIQKTIEVDVCDQCGREVGEGHIKTCVACKKEICPNCAIHFDVTIHQIWPYRQEDGNYGFSFKRHSSDKTGWRGTYCGPCGTGIDANLAAAGLIRFVPEKERGGVELD